MIPRETGRPTMAQAGRPGPQECEISYADAHTYSSLNWLDQQSHSSQSPGGSYSIIDLESQGISEPQYTFGPQQQYYPPPAQLHQPPQGQFQFHHQQPQQPSQRQQTYPPQQPLHFQHPPKPAPTSQPLSPIYHQPSAIYNNHLSPPQAPNCRQLPGQQSQSYIPQAQAVCHPLSPRLEKQPQPQPQTQQKQQQPYQYHSQQQHYLPQLARQPQPQHHLPQPTSFVLSAYNSQQSKSIAHKQAARLDLYPDHLRSPRVAMGDNQQQPTAQSAPSTTAKPKLIWLLFMHRHGDRAPLNMAPRDKYNNVSYWPEGFGNLNNAGRLRMYKLGKFIRQRYDGFVTDNMREIYSRSSDVDRCIESSHAVLAGLYPPSSRFEWCKELPWIPAPVHTVPAPDDYLLNEAGRKFLIDCINELHLIQNSEAVKELYAESVKERELMERELGYEYEMFYKFKCTYSTLDIEERANLPMPAWYTPELKQKLYRFAGKAFGLAGGGTEKLKKIRCGHLLEDIVTRMEMASIDGPKLKCKSDFSQPTNAPTESDDRRIVHYSTHDSLIAAFLEALNINSPIQVPPGFGATFFVELYVDLNDQGLPVSEKYIKLFYMDDTESEKPIEKKLPNCKLNEKGQLTLNNFKQYIASLLPS